MDRSAVHALAKRGQSQRSIARQMGVSRNTVAQVLAEPVDRRFRSRSRPSAADLYRAQIEEWLRQGLSVVRMLEKVRRDPERPYRGGRSAFGERVRKIRGELERQSGDVSIRFEGLPGEYLQVDWGEARRLRFSQHPSNTRYFLCCRLKYSRRRTNTLSRWVRLGM